MEQLDLFNEAPEAEKTERAPQRCKRGDVWRLGDHVLMCGDSLNGEDVARLMRGGPADLVVCDPPYGMGKESAGVLNDNKNLAELLDFNRAWIPLSFKHLRTPGSWYCFGVDEPLMDIYVEILKPMIRAQKCTFKNLITWDKGSAPGSRGTGMRQYQIADEKILFCMTGQQKMGEDQTHFFEGFEPVRAKLSEEARKAGLTPNKLHEICGVGMYSHWFTRSEWTFIPEHHYITLAEHCEKHGIKAFARAYFDGLREAFYAARAYFDGLREAFYAARAYFDGTHDVLTNVWRMGRTPNAERALCGGHATPKPLKLLERIVKTSSRPGAVVLDLFGGSGSTLIACELLKRSCRMMEYSEYFCDVIIHRWERITGRSATREAAP